MRYLTIALAKGRFVNRAMEMFKAVDISRDEAKDKASREPIFVNKDLGACFFLAEANDVPTYVEYGAADISIAGRDIVLEEGRKLYEIMDSGVRKCRMCVCGPESARERLEHHEPTRVATRYSNVAEDYFYNWKYQTVEIIKLNGSIELTPIVGLSEVIMDTVETGSTLWESGLMVLEEVYGLPVRVVVNQVSMRMESERVTAIIKKFQLYPKKNVRKQDDRSKSGKRRNVGHENRGIR